MGESIQQKLLRIRPPRVRITYDVEIGDAIEKRELPFIVGIFSDLSGDRESPSTLPAYKDRRLTDIDRDVFDDVMSASCVRLSLASITDPVATTDPTKPVNFTFSGTKDANGKVLLPAVTALLFKSLDDFEPLSIVHAVPALSSRYQARGKIRKLQGMAEVNDQLAELLDSIVSSGGAAARTSLLSTFPADQPDTWRAAAVNTGTPPVQAATVPPKDAQEKEATVPPENTQEKGATVPPETTQEKEATVPTEKVQEPAATVPKAALPDITAQILDLLFTPTALPADATDAAKAVIQAADASSKASAMDLIGNLVAEVIAPLNASSQLAWNKGVSRLTDERVKQIDEELSMRLSAIMHSPTFQAIESTWRGLQYLVFRTETSTMLKLRLFNATKDELLADMEKAVEFDQSALFKMVYEAEYGTLGGTPYSLLVGGYELGRNPQDIEFLKKITEVAAAAHAPFIAAASPNLFGLPRFDQLARPRDLAKTLDSNANPDLQGWTEFRQMEDSRYVTLVLPHALLRLPYGENTLPAEGLDFTEDVTGPDNSKFLWGNVAFVIAERITNAFSLYNWTAAIRGVEGGGLVEGLPLYTYSTDAHLRLLFCPTELDITDRREKELNDLGFIALCHQKGTGNAVFFGGQTTNLPKKYNTDSANANAKISAMLPYMLAASRFAHYIKVIMRDKIGSFQTRGTIEAHLNTWISQYVLLDDNASQDVKAAFPLRAANIVVTDVPGSPGAYQATVFLKPHFQLEELTTSIRLVAQLPV